MATSQNGWVAQTTPPSGRLSWVTGRVHPDCVVVFDHLCRRFHEEVEPIRQDWSWGWAFRPIRASSGLSNHSSGTAIDLNAPRHGLGQTGTFSSAQRDKIHEILAFYEGAIRWGGDYRGRKDEMHVEVNWSPAAFARITAKVRQHGGAIEGDGFDVGFREWDEADKKALADYIWQHPLFKDQKGKTWRAWAVLQRSATGQMVKDRFNNLMREIKRDG